MTEELLKAIHAKTNAIDAVNTALQAEWALLEELSALTAKSDKPVDYDMVAIQDKVAELKALNAALPAAVVANVTPASAGPVGESPAEQTLKAGAAAVDSGLAQARDGVARVQDLLSALSDIVNGLNLASAGVKTGESAKQL